MAKYEDLPAPVRDWVDALRSGDYKQGQYRLTDFQGNNCCLGVACKRAQIAGVAIAIEDYGSGLCYDNQVSSLPESVQNYLGIYTTDGWARGVFLAGDFHTLAAANDSGDYDFAQIADIIVDRWEDLRDEDPPVS